MLRSQAYIIVLSERDNWCCEYSNSFVYRAKFQSNGLLLRRWRKGYSQSKVTCK